MIVNTFDYFSAYTLPTYYVSEHDDTYGTHTRVHSSGWTITGEIIADHYKWVNNFEAEHPVLGIVKGNFEEEVWSTSEQALASFIEAHPPKKWDYGDI